MELTREEKTELYKRSDEIKERYKTIIANWKAGIISSANALQSLDKIKEEVNAEKSLFESLGASGILKYIGDNYLTYKEMAKRKEIEAIDQKEMIKKVDSLIDELMDNWDYPVWQNYRVGAGSYIPEDKRGYLDIFDKLKEIIDDTVIYADYLRDVKNHLDTPKMVRDIGFLYRKRNYMKNRIAEFIEKDKSGNLTLSKFWLKDSPYGVPWDRIPLEGNIGRTLNEIVVMTAENQFDSQSKDGFKYRADSFISAKVCHFDKDGIVRDLKEGYTLDLLYEKNAANIYGIDICGRDDEYFYHLLWCTVDENSFNKKNKRVYLFRPGTKGMMDSWREDNIKMTIDGVFEEDEDEEVDA